MSFHSVTTPLNFLVGVKKGKSKFIRTISNSFKMSFYVTFSKYKFDGIIGVEGTGTSQNFIHSSPNFERKKNDEF